MKSHSRRRLARRIRFLPARRPRGQALTEFALVLPVMLLILLIAADFGRLFFSYIQVTNAAREGANYASLRASDSPFDLGAFISGATAAALGEANVQSQAGAGALRVDEVVCLDSPSAGAEVNCDAAANFAGGIGNYVRVTASEDFTFLTPGIAALVGVLPLSSTVTAPVLNPPVAPPAPEPPPGPGSLVVRKTLAGDLTGFGGGTFTFDVSCDGVDYGPAYVNLASGTASTTVNGIPAGAECTVTEIDQPRAGNHASWDSPGPEQATIIEDGVATVTITNTRTYTDPVEGSLVVVKTLAGDLTGFTGGEFTFRVTCDGTEYGPVVLRLDSGTLASDPITGIPEGAECTVTETDKPAAGADASWDNPGPELVTIVRNRQTDAVITNTRTYIPPCTNPRVTISPATTVATGNSKQLTVSFTATAAGAVTSWTWDFDDGTTAEGSTATHRFTYTLGKGSGPQSWEVTLNTTGSCPGTGRATVTLDWR